MSFNCTTDNCLSKKGPYKCDICMRLFCDDHILVLKKTSDLLYNEKVYEALLENPTIRLMVAQHVFYVCKDCIALAELKEIDDFSDDDIFLLINRDFITDSADEYFFRRITGEGRDPHIFDFGIKMIKDLIKKLKEEKLC